MNEGRSNGSTKAHHPERDWTPDRRAKVATVEGKKVGEKQEKVSDLSQIMLDSGYWILDTRYWILNCRRQSLEVRKGKPPGVVIQFCRGKEIA